MFKCIRKTEGACGFEAAAEVKTEGAGRRGRSGVDLKKTVKAEMKFMEDKD